MAVLEYNITGNNTGLVTAITGSIAAINKLQLAIDGLNKSAASIGGLGGAFQKAGRGADGFAAAAKRGTQAFKDQQIAAALDRLQTKFTVINANVQLFGATLQTNKQSVAALQQALNSLVANGVDPLDSRVTGLKNNINSFNKTISEQKAGGGSIFSGIGGQLTSVIASFGSIYAIGATIKKVVASNAEISDSLADVRRTASLTAAEAENLANQLKKIDTRTSLKGLLDIAVIGGQLGIAKDQLGGFTRSVDQLSVSLGGELKGGPEEIAQSLGILDKVFGITAKNGGDVEKSFNQIGSVILGLGQSGLATGDFLADFGKRVGGVAAQAKLSLPVLLSYGATLQEQGVSAEVAGTSFKKLLGSLATKRGAFLPIAQIADSSLTLKSFTDIINNDTQRALSLFFEGLAKGGSTTTAFSDLLKSVGLDAARSGQAITALALHQTELNKHIAESIPQYQNATLAQDQFAIKNDTLGASIDKLSNAFVKATTSGGISSFFKSIIDGVTGAITAFDKLLNSRSFTEVLARVVVLNSKITPLFPGANNLGKSFDTANSIQDNFKASNSVLKAENLNPIGASNDIVVSSLTEKSSAELKDLISKYSSAAKQAVQALNDYRRGIASGLLKDGAANGITVQDATKNYQGLLKNLSLVSQAYIQVRDKSSTSKTGIVKDAVEISDAELKTVKAINARILELKNDTLGNPDNSSADISRIDALRERLAQFNSKSSGLGNPFDSLNKQLDEIFRKTQIAFDQSGLQGYDLEVQKINDKYKEQDTAIQTLLNSQQKLAGKGKITPTQLGVAQGKAQRDFDVTDDARQKELSDAAIAEAKRVKDEIQRINDEFGVKSEQSRAKELAQIQARYDAEIAKAKGNAAILSALDADRIIAIQAINDKYAQIELDLQNKISDIDDQARADISGKQESDTQKIINEWEKRRTAANKYYEELKTLEASKTPTGLPGVDNIINGFNIGKINAKQEATNTNINSAETTDVNRKIAEPLVNALQNGIRTFGTDFFNTITNVDTYAKGTFISIFSDFAKNLTQSLNQVILSTITNGLSKALSKAIADGTSSLIGKNGVPTTGGLFAAGAALAGSVVSAATPQTSTTGQVLGGALSGAGTGALIGSVLPGVGTVVGAVAGGLIGAIGGFFSSKSARDKEAQQRAEQLEQEKQQTAILRAQLDAYTSTVIGRVTANGVVTGVTVGATGELVATVSGKDLQFVLDRNAKSR